MLTFIHSGDIGDAIYSLPVMRSAAHGERFRVLLGNLIHVRRDFDPVWAENLASLVRIQPYIYECRYWKIGDTWDVNCDLFRKYLMAYHVRGKNIASYVCDALQQDYGCTSGPWLWIDEPWCVDGCPIVVNRTFRYNNPMFPWVTIYNKYRGRMVFIGTQEEHTRFCDTIGSLPFCPTKNLLEVARMIAGAKLFIGNQSVCYAIAEGFKQNTIQEADRRVPDCIWPRHNAIIGFDQRVPLPEIEAIRHVNIGELNERSTVNV